MSENGDTNQQPKNKTIIFTLDERKLLLKLINMHYDVVNSKKVDSLSIQLKNKAWKIIHKNYLENTNLIKFPRTPQQLKRCWENMKCKAKRGDPMSAKLLRWAEAQYKLLQKENKDSNEKISNSFPADSLEEEESDIEFNDDIFNYQPKAKVEDIQGDPNPVLSENLVEVKNVLENSECGHCDCDKVERTAKIQLLALEKQQSKELHQLKVQLTKEKIQHARELHKLYVHEMTLKVENERRRAEILDRELGN